jgi:hypothetical protein
MRQLLLAFACAFGLTGCFCGDTTITPDITVGTFDMRPLPMCPSGVDAVGKDRIACGASDSQCLYQESPQVTITCRCLPCGKVWECDAVLEVCDGGTP